MRNPELHAKYAEVQISEPELFNAGAAVCRGPGTVIVQPGAADGLSAAAALQFAGVPLRQMPDMSVSTLVFPVREWPVNCWLLKPVPTSLTLKVLVFVVQ